MTNEELYKKYPHIIKGSIEKIQRGQIVTGGKKHKIKSHGKIAVIKCINTDENLPYCRRTRVINVQDAKQTTYCQACTRFNRNARRRARRRAMNK